MTDADRFESLLGAGDVAGALMAAPFGYTSRSTGHGFRFEIKSGRRSGSVGEATTLLYAVRKAWSGSLPDGGRDK